MRKQTLLYKICYSALFIALTIILSRFFALPGLFGLSFLKISFANSVVLFSSFYLGPLWGMIVGGASDVLGAILFPQGGAFNPLFTIPALLTGLFPYYFYKLINYYKIERKIPIVLMLLLSAFAIFSTVILLTNDSIGYGKTNYTFEPWLKITLICLIFGLSIFYITAAVIVKIKFKNKKINENYNIFTLMSSMFLTYMLIKNPISSIITAYVLNYDFLFVLFIKLMTGFFTCLVHSIIVIFSLNITLMLNNRSALLEPMKLPFKKETQNEKSA